MTATDVDESRPALLARARQLRPQLRAEQDAADDAGRYSPAVHEAFARAGFYRMTRPTRYGGLASDFATYYGVVTELATGHPGAAWCFALATAHVWLFASHWPEEAQRHVLDTPEEVIIPYRGGAGVPATPTDGGFEVDGTFGYASGSPYSTHMLGNATVQDGGTGATRPMIFIAPRDRYTIVDDWGGDRTLGMRASGSYSLRLDRVFVPGRDAVPFDPFLLQPAVTGRTTPGIELHGSAIYLGPQLVPFQLNLTAVVIGAARAALEHSTAMSLEKPNAMGPGTRSTDAFVQQALGAAAIKVDAAEALMYRSIEEFEQRCVACVHDGERFATHDHLRLWGLAQLAATLSCDAIDGLFRTGGSSASFAGSVLRRYLGDAAMYRTHPLANVEWLAAMLGRTSLGLPCGIPGL